MIIIAPRGWEATLRARLETLGLLATGAEGVFVVERGGARIYVSHNDWVEDEYEPAELERIRGATHDPVFYALDFSDLALCKEVLETLADASVRVDNDAGLCLPGSEFLQHLRDHPTWDWRLATK